MTIQQRLEELLKLYGTYRALSMAVKLDVGYLHRLHTGEKTNPTDDVLERLGLRRVITYERL